MTIAHETFAHQNLVSKCRVGKCLSEHNCHSDICSPDLCSREICSHDKCSLGYFLPQIEDCKFVIFLLEENSITNIMIDPKKIRHLLSRTKKFGNNISSVIFFRRKFALNWSIRNILRIKSESLRRRTFCHTTFVLWPNVCVTKYLVTKWLWPNV